MRRGDVYDTIIEYGYLSRLLDGSLSVRTAAEIIGVSEEAIRRGLRAAVEDTEIEAKAKDWTASGKVAALLGPTSPPADVEPGTDEWWAFIDEMTTAFVAFRDEYFRLPSGALFITSVFHRLWIRQVLNTIWTGGHSMILSPPRHGKSELLVHFCVWLICRNPNVRIAWIGGNKDIAADMVGAVREHLADNEALIEDMLPQGKTFRPKGRASGEWQASKFTVANRTVFGIKASTMVAIGRGGKILSRDMDFIICDDIEDHDSTLIESSRATTRGWFNQDLYSRKEEHTGLFVIGSRQHFDDLYGYLLDSDVFDTIVDSAHDELCDKDPLNEEAHTDCCLFPELRSYKWLMTKKRSAEALGLPHIYEMVYLNRPRPIGGSTFVKEEIEPAFNRDRGLGIENIPPIQPADETAEPPERRLSLVAGLDPAFTGYQASFCWAYDSVSNQQFMVDLDNNLGGGVVPALTIMQEWLALYDLRHWVVEANLMRTGLLDDPRIVEWSRANDVYIEPHETQQNKHDEFYGVTSFRRLYIENMIDLPYWGDAARAKTNLYVQQLLAYSDENKRRSNTRSDIVMASWFPMRAIRRWQKETQASMSVQYDEDFSGWEELFDIGDEVPW